MKGIKDKAFSEDASDIGKIMEEDLLYENTMMRAEKDAPLFYETLKKHGFESVMAARIRRRDNIRGYLVCAVKHSHRIWQENECAVLYYLAGLLAETETDI